MIASLGSMQQCDTIVDILVALTNTYIAYIHGWNGSTLSVLFGGSFSIQRTTREREKNIHYLRLNKNKSDERSKRNTHVWDIYRNRNARFAGVHSHCIFVIFETQTEFFIRADYNHFVPYFEIINGQMDINLINNYWTISFNIFCRCFTQLSVAFSGSSLSLTSKCDLVSWLLPQKYAFSGLNFEYFFKFWNTFQSICRKNRCSVISWAPWWPWKEIH